MTIWLCREEGQEPESSGGLNWVSQIKAHLVITPGWNLCALNAGPEKGGVRQKAFVHASLTSSHTGRVSQKVEMLCRIREAKFSPRARGIVSGMSRKFKN